MSAAYQRRYWERPPSNGSAALRAVSADSSIFYQLNLSGCFLQSPSSLCHFAMTTGTLSVLLTWTRANYPQLTDLHLTPYGTRSTSLLLRLIQVGPRQGGPARPSLPPATSPGSYALEDSVWLLVLSTRSYLTPSRQQGQGGENERQQRDLRAELLQAEAAHFAKKKGVPVDEPMVENAAPKRQLEAPSLEAGADEEEDPEAKRRRILEETRDIDADSEGDEDDSSEEER